MPKITVEEAKDFSVLPVDSIVNVKVEELSIEEVNGRTGTWTKLKAKFKVLGIQATGDGSPIGNYDDVIGGPLYGSVPFKLTDHPENKLRQWAEAILGMELGVGFELDTDMFLGRTCRALTSQYERRGTSGAAPSMRHQVESLLPAAPAGGFGQPSGYAQPQPQYAPPAQQQMQFAPPQQQHAQPVQTAPAQDPWATPQPAGGAGWEEPPF